MKIETLEKAILISKRIEKLKNEKFLIEQGKINPISVMIGTQSTPISMANVEVGKLKDQIILTIKKKIKQAEKEIKAL